MIRSKLLSPFKGGFGNQSLRFPCCDPLITHLHLNHQRFVSFRAPMMSGIFTRMDDSNVDSIHDSTYLSSSIQTIHHSNETNRPGSSNPSPSHVECLLTEKGTNPIRFVDIGANLLDDMFKGIYRDKQLHENDLIHVLHRAYEAGCEHIIITAGTIQASLQAIELCQQMNRFMTSAENSPKPIPKLKTTVSYCLSIEL